MFDQILPYIITFFVSMVPIIELRGAIPIGVGFGGNPWICRVGYVRVVKAYNLNITGNINPLGGKDRYYACRHSVGNGKHAVELRALVHEAFELCNGISVTIVTIYNQIFVKLYAIV